MKHYIIDAHNVIHKSAFLSSQIQVSLDVARNSLVQMLSQFSQKYASYKFTVIFDGKIGYNSVKNKSIHIISSLEREADELIKEKVANLKSTKNVIVVSSDNAVISFAKVHACDTLSSQDFLAIINTESETSISKSSAKPRRKTKSEKPNFTTKKDFDEFKKLFSE